MITDKKIAFLLSFVSGYMDAAGFLALSKTFVAHVTGNLVVAASSLGHGGSSLYAGKILLLPVFFIGVVVTSYCIKHRKAGLHHLILVEGIFLLLFTVTGCLMYKLKAESTAVAVNGVAAIGILGLSIQNTYMKLLLPAYPPTTAMTGNITVFSSGLSLFADYLTPGNALVDPAGIRAILSQAGVPILGFVFGCLIAGFLLKIVGFISCCLPALILLLLYRRIRNRTLS